MAEPAGTKQFVYSKKISIFLLLNLKSNGVTIPLTHAHAYMHNYIISYK